MVSGCATLPSSGPTAREIIADQQRTDLFTIVDLDGTVPVPTDTAQTPTALATLAAVGDTQRIGPGDVLQVSIYEVGPALFAGRSSWTAGAVGGMAAPPSAAAETLPPLTVARDGTITVPWAGHLQVAGLTTDTVANAIRARLRGLSQDPQVIVGIRENLANTVMVIGDIRKPGRVPLTLAGERLLDAIALAGGTSNPPEDDVVRVDRGGATASAPLAAIVPGSPDDTVLMPHDRISIVHEPRTFTVFGATGKVSEIPFQNSRVTLAEAIARAGGPSDTQADPKAVFVFRFEPSFPPGSPSPGARPVAYRLNMMNARSYFVAQRFAMRSRDVVYIANARSNIPTKLVQIFNLFFSPFYTARVLAQ